MSLATFLLQLPRNTKRAILIISDSIFLPLAFVSAEILKLGKFGPISNTVLVLLPIIPIISIPVFIRIGLYRAVVRYMSGKAFYTILKGVTISSFILYGLSYVLPLSQLHRSIFVIYWAFALLYIGGSRLIVRDYFNDRQRQNDRRELVAIYGAGSAGIQLAMGLLSGRDYRPVAFIDEKSELIGAVVKGIRVFPQSKLRELVSSLGIKQVLLAIPSASRARRKEILNHLEDLPVHVRTIPGLAELVSGNAQVEDIQEVDIADLLGRDPVPPQTELLAKCITGKSVMITGAGGSIGAELSRQILELQPKRIVLYEASEFALYKIEQELKALRRSDPALQKVDMKVVLGSVTHRRRVEAVIRSFDVNTIYHAAAYKHVPLVEHNPIEGVQNNLFGTWRTAEAAEAAGVETFVLVSTDKAVRPTNVMGATKRMAELVLQAMARRKGKTRYVMVRFGNVLGSSGSVVPLFRKQIRDGGPITVTHSEITRYFMTIPEAAQLVLQAGSMGEGGDVFVLDMGESVKIADLARRMVKLSGLEVLDDNNPEGDIEIVYTGLRPGEKLYEELLIGDCVSGTDHPRIMRAKEMEVPWDELSDVLNKLQNGCSAFDSAEVRKIMESTITEYQPQCGIVDPVWHQLTNNQDLSKIIALPLAAEDVVPPRVMN